MIDYTKPTPETDAFMAKIDGDEIDLEMVRAKLHDMEVERDYARSQASEWHGVAWRTMRRMRLDTPHNG